MTYVVTQACCNRRLVHVGVPGQLHPPRPRRAGLRSTEMVYVDPDSLHRLRCVRRCVPRVGDQAARAAARRRAGLRRHQCRVLRDRPLDLTWAAPTFPVVRGAPERPPDAWRSSARARAAYTARELLTTSSAHVSMIDRLPVVGGLVRAGVAPDHPDTKRLADMFAWTYDHPRTSMFLNVEVGRDVDPR